MTEVKIPEPEYMGCDSVGDIFAYSEAQLKQYGDDRARQAVESCANAVHEIPRNGAWVTKMEAIAAIEELLANEIK